ncbi:hypothetical protein DPX16_16870 [Anabarilius grahami]|uniref:Uncharacterized protein n=1 Tax=Anabarilius grahami TaxID=495550 RepID=A0A3N0YSV4_ANAGA|nr:hypothetical protein DPX16_16870 [Anabarilius grahami]
MIGSGYSISMFVVELFVQTTSLALPPPCYPPIQKCVLWGRARDVKALPCQGDRVTDGDEEEQDSWDLKLIQHPNNGLSWREGFDSL